MIPDKGLWRGASSTWIALVVPSNEDVLVYVSSTFQH